LIPPQLSNGLSRVSFIHNPNTSAPTTAADQRRTSTLVSHLLASRAIEMATPAQLLTVLGISFPRESGGEQSQKVLSQQATLEELMGGVSIDNVEVSTYEWYAEASRRVVQQLGLAPGQQAVLLNGRVSEPAIRWYFGLTQLPRSSDL
jgi:UDP-glucose:glycoprotein glucosyltransferase